MCNMRNTCTNVTIIHCVGNNNNMNNVKNKKTYVVLIRGLAHKKKVSCFV